MRYLGIMISAAVISAGPALSALAQDTPKPKPTTTTVQVQKLHLVRGNDLIGKDVVNQKGETLGKIEELVLHPKGEVAFAVLSTSGHLEKGQKLIPVPWRAVRENEDGQLVLDIKPDDFAKAEGFDKDKWADLTKVDWWKDRDRDFDKQKMKDASPVEASASIAPTKLFYRASEIKNRNVESPDGEKIASIHEVVVDPRVGRISYVVLSVGGFLGTGEKMIAVPWDALKVAPAKDNPKLERLTLATTREKLEKAPEFLATTEGWTTASEPDYLLRVYEYYAVPPYWVPVTK